MIATTFGENMLVVNTNGAAGFIESTGDSGPPPEGDKARTVAVTPDGSRAVIGNILSDNVTIVDLAGQAVEGHVPVGDRPAEVAITPDGTRAVVANPDNFLKPGMFGYARLAASQPYRALLVPDTAIVTDAARRVVYVVGPQNDVTAKPVELGPLVGGLRVIRRGLAATDKVIIGGIQRARPGQKVQPKAGRIAASGGPEPAPVPPALAPSKHGFRMRSTPD